MENSKITAHSAGVKFGFLAPLPGKEQHFLPYWLATSTCKRKGHATPGLSPWKILKTRTLHFVFSLNISSLLTLYERQLRRLACLQTFVWFFCCYLLTRLFRNFSFNSRKKTWEKSRKRSDIVQFGRCRDNFSSSVCSALSQSMLFHPVTARIISELCYKWLSSAQKVGSPRGIWFLSTSGLLSCNGTFAVFFLCSTHHSSPLFLHLHGSSICNSKGIDFVSYYLLYSTFAFV